MTKHRLRGARRSCARLLGWVLVGSLGAAPAALAGADSPIDDEVFYHFMPVAWRDADGDPLGYGDFEGMTASLEYLGYLGVTAVWLNPIFPSPAYHGYQHGRADEVNPRMGTEAAFVNFVQAAHAAGIKVYLDLVVYGISCQDQWYTDAFGNPGSPFDSWLAFTNGSNTSWLGGSYSTWNGDPVCFIHWNLNEPGPTDLVTTWSQKWLDPNNDGDFTDGIDGYRLDHVWVNYPSGPNGWGYNLDDFWEPWRAALASVNPDVVIFAEQANWGSFGAELLTAFDAAFTKPFEFAARDALASENAGPLYASMAATVTTVPPERTYLCTIGNHDVDRLASVIGDSFTKGKAAAAVLMTQPFTPVVYYGDEIGMRGRRESSNGSDAVDIPFREPFKWKAVAGPPMTDYVASAVNPQVLANAYAQDNDGRSVEEQRGESGSLLEAYRQLIALRKDNPALRRGAYFPVPNSNEHVWAFLRDEPNGQTLLVVINLAGSTQLVFLDLGGVEIPAGSTTVTDLLSGGDLATLTGGNASAYLLGLEPYDYLVAELDVIPPQPAPQVVDGRSIPADIGLDTARAVQNNVTGMGDNSNELNALFVRVEELALRVGLTGNLATDGTAMALFVDSGPGGQNPLATAGFSQPPGGIPQVSGMLLDDGFEPDAIVFVNAFGGSIYVDLYTLATGGNGQKRYVGQGTINDGDGFLTGGSNPNNLLVALDTTNQSGVTEASTAGAANASHGFEMWVPLADLGLTQPAGSVKVMAMLLRSNGEVGNQFLPGLGGGYGNLGFVPIDLADIPGDQFVEISLARPPFDWDGDGDVDVRDYAELAACWMGPGSPSPATGCGFFDSNGDARIDLVDFAAAQRAFTAP